MAKKGKKTKGDEPEVEETTTDLVGEPLSAKEVGLHLGVDARIVRKYLRDRHGKVGQGRRWVLDSDQLDDLTADFHEWHKPKVKETTDEVADDTDDELDDDFEEDFELLDD